MEKEPDVKQALPEAEGKKGDTRVAVFNLTIWLVMVAIGIWKGHNFALMFGASPDLQIALIGTALPVLFVVLLGIPEITTCVKGRKWPVGVTIGFVLIVTLWAMGWALKLETAHPDISEAVWTVGGIMVFVGLPMDFVLHFDLFRENMYTEPIRSFVLYTRAIALPHALAAGVAFYGWRLPYP